MFPTGFVVRDFPQKSWEIFRFLELFTLERQKKLSKEIWSFSSDNVTVQLEGTQEGTELLKLFSTATILNGLR